MDLLEDKAIEKNVLIPDNLFVKNIEKHMTMKVIHST